MSIERTASNTLICFDVEATTEMANSVGVEIEFVLAKRVTLVNGIVSDRYDISMAPR